MVTVNSGVGEQRFLADHELGLYRVAQELVNNTAKHAQATEATIDLHLHQNDLRLAYKDNGSGFDPATVTPGLGLKNLEPRAQIMGGTLELHGGVAQGFLAELHIPTKNPLNES